MKARAGAALLLAAFCLLLCGCGDFFDRDYLSVTDYEIPAQEPPAEDSVTVRDLAELRQFLTGLLNDQASEGRIVFDSSYEGDINADIASACWQVRTQDAFFAYCVANISYDVSKLVNHYEARFTISYNEAGEDPDSIVRLQLTTGLAEQLRQAIARGESRLVVLIGRSSMTAEDVENLASKVYRENPIVEPREPRVNVNMLSGTGSQRLYEISFNYNLSDEELQQRRAELQALEPFAEAEQIPEDSAEQALLACEYLLEHSSYSESASNDIYAALIGGEANSEGLALAYVELCRQLEVPCQVVYGQRNWRNCCWNIIQLEGNSYHVDVSACMTLGIDQGFLLPDETMWTLYRWDISSYPPCSGELRYADLRPMPEDESEGEISSADEPPSGDDQTGLDPGAIE